jgi:phosphoglycerate-specific signal transduction histidine kinase
MKKQIIINNIKKYNDYKNIYDISNNIKSFDNNIVKETKKSYIELQELNNNIISIDASYNILEYYDNYDKQLICINSIYSQSIEHSKKNDIKQPFLQALKKKLASYKQQDIKKNYNDYANFITLENIIEKLVSCSMKCYYCNTNTLILFKNVREETQWTLDRLNNYDEHSNSNTIICCLKCNLQRRRKNSTKFKFSKQMNIIKKID